VHAHQPVTANSDGWQQNRFLSALPSSQLAGIASQLDPVRLESKQVLAVPEETIRDIYFPVDTVVSLLVPMQEGKAVEGATVGNEGLVGLQAFLGGGAATEEIVVQIPGQAGRMHAADFRAALAHSFPLQTLLKQYTLALMNQLARTAGCNKVHPVEARCARWLLMCRDRVGRDTFPLTHESLASLLGVRRASVTETAGALQEAGIIHYHRGTLTILDPQRLEAAACEDYRLSKAAYDELYV
jgi:CRP-like cAMP-binding protein